MLPAELQKIMFLDIETVPQTASLAELPAELAHMWEEKYVQIKSRMPDRYPVDMTAAEAYAGSAGIWAEFGKIVCISVGFIYFKGNEKCFRTKSFSGHDEAEILQGFAALLQKFCSTKEHTLCGHNIREFDIPYICRRMLIHKIALPDVLNIAGKKPWEVNFIDTLERWRFGDYKNYTSLKMLTSVFGIPTPKDDIDGSMVGEVYYKTGDVQRIAAYCQKDVIATAQVFLSLMAQPHISYNNIDIIL